MHVYAGFMTWNSCCICDIQIIRCNLLYSFQLFIRQGDPNSVNVNLTFKGNETENLNNNIINAIVDFAKRVPAGDTQLLMVGDLLISPFNITGPYIPHNITIEPTPTVSIIYSELWCFNYVRISRPVH